MIKLSHLTKTYISSKKIETTALKDINLIFPETGIIFITGKTGCGKSTLLNILGKLDKPTSGEIYVGEEDITKFNDKQNDDYRNNFAGFVFQEYNLIDELSVYENIAMAKKLQGKEPDEKEIDELLRKLDLSEQKHKKCDELSGGQKQRVAIVRAIIKGPKLILADEPTGALDTKTGKEILEILKEISKNTLVIVVSHDLDYANTYADRIIKMEDGRVIEDTLPILEDNYTEKITTTRGKFSVKDSFKLGMFNLNHRVKRLIIMVLVSFVAFTLIGVFATFVSLDESKVVFETMKRENLHQLTFKNGQSDYIEKIPYEMIEEYTSKFPNKKFYPIYETANDVYYNFEYNLDQISLESGGGFYDTNVYGEMELNEEIANYLGFQLLAGSYPTSDDEILITDYHYDLFTICGYKENRNSSLTEISSYEDIIGKIISVDNPYNDNGYNRPTQFDFKIVGIVNTNFKFKEYMKDESNFKDRYPEITFQVRLSACLSSYFFHNAGYLERFTEKYNQNSFIRRFGASFSFNYEYNGTVEDGAFYSNSISYFSYNQKGVVKYFEEHSSELGYDELVVSWEKLKLTCFIIVDNERMRLDQYLNRYVYGENVLGDLDDYDTGEQYDDPIEEIKVLSWRRENKAIDYVISQKLLENIYNTKITYLDRDNLESGRTTKNLKFVGIVNPYPLEDISNFDALISDKFFEEVKHSTRSYTYIGFCTYLNFKNDRKFMKEIYKLKSDIKPYNTYISKVNGAKLILSRVSKICLVASIALSIFAGTLFYTYIRFVIDDKRKQIGVIRSLGGRKQDLLKIFLTESFIIGGAIALLSIIGSAVLTAFFNGYLDGQLNFHLKILSYGPLSVLLIIGLALLISFIATYIPINKISKLNPVDSLKTSR